MPWSPAQHRLFEWAAHSPQAAQAQGYKIPPAKAAQMAAEGVKPKARQLAASISNSRVGAS